MLVLTKQSWIPSFQKRKQLLLFCKMIVSHPVFQEILGKS